MLKPTSTGQEIIFYVSIGNLVLLPFWFLAFARNGMPTDAKFVDNYYELAQVFDNVDYLTALLLAVLLGVTMMMTSRGLARWSPRAAISIDRLAAIAGLTVFAMAIWVMIAPPDGNSRVTDNWILPILGAGALTVLVIGLGFVFRARLVDHVLKYGILITAPVGLMLAFNGIVAWYKIGPPDGNLLAADRSLAEIRRNDAPDRQRVVVIFFDMWDYGVTFERRPDWLKLPEIDRIASTSFFATDAQRAAASTRIAFPSMLTGRKVYWSWPVPGDDLSLVFAERYSPESWREHPGVFKSARDAGYNTAVAAAAYHPYCRLFRQYISHCWIDDTPFEYTDRNVVNRMDNVVKEVLRRVPGVGDALFKPRERHHPECGVHLYFAFKEEMKRLVANKDYDFVFAHWYLPHPPFIRHARTGEWQYFDEEASRDHYFGNLKALDLAVGELRQSMEAAGLWENTTVLLTADHGYTLLDWSEHVPPVRHAGAVHLETGRAIGTEGQRKTIYDNQPQTTARGDVRWQAS
jgi:arylsulfatase A-like enzyme